MRRGGGSILGLIAVAAMAGGAGFAFRPILGRETLTLAYLASLDARAPSSASMISGARFAVEEAGSKAGGYKINFIVPAGIEDPKFQISISASGSHVVEGRIQGSKESALICVLPGLEDQGRSAAAWARTTGSRKIVLLCDNATPSSLAILQGFTSGAGKTGFTFEGPIDTAIDRDILLDRVMSANPDLLFYTGEAAPYSTANFIFDALRKKGYAGRLAMGDADPEVSYLAVSHHVVDGTYLISSIGPPSKGFSAAYEPATNRRAGPHAWPAYLTMKAILEIIDQAGSNRVENLRWAAALHGTPRSPCALYVSREGKFEFVHDLN
jgi:ABC-type branched-subunit amino acid transport system substrate-binding protein